MGKKSIFNLSDAGWAAEAGEAGRAAAREAIAAGLTVSGAATGLDEADKAPALIEVSPATSREAGPLARRRKVRTARAQRSAHV